MAKLAESIHNLDSTLKSNGLVASNGPITSRPVNQ